MRSVTSGVRGGSGNTCVSRSWSVHFSTPAALAICLQRAFSFEATIPPLRARLPPSWSEKPKQRRWRRNPFGTDRLAPGAGVDPWPAFPPIGPRRPHSTPLHPQLLPRFGGHREIEPWAPERTFPRAKESGSQRREKSSGKAAARRMGECHEASIRAAPSHCATDHLGVPSAGASAPGARGRLPPPPRGPSSRHARVWSRGPGAAFGRVRPGAAAALPTPEGALGPGSGEASVFPTPVARGAQEQPPDAPRRLGGEGLGLGERGAFCGRPRPGPHGSRDGRDRRGGPGTRGAVRSALEPGSPPAEGGTAGAPATQAARAAARSSATAPRTPGKPPPERPPLHRRRGVGKRTHRALGADKRSPGRWLPTSPRLQSCGLGPAGSQPSHDSLWGLGR